MTLPHGPSSLSLKTLGSFVTDDRQPSHNKKKPLLRGVSHALAAVASVAGAVLLWKVTEGDRPRQITMLVFGLSLVALYAASATYHLGTWKGKAYMLFRRMDHAMIFVLIAGTYTPFCFTLLSGTARTTMLLLSWGYAIAGVSIKLFFPFLKRRFSVPIYLGAGWLAVFQIHKFVQVLSPHGLALLAAGGLAYTLGAIFYALRRPNPFPGIFGYHEVFHLLVITGSLTHFLAVLYYIAPMPRA
jgi:hemolysin III